MEKKIEENIKEMLVLGYEVVKGEAVLGKGIGKINTNGEETIELDEKLEDLFIGYIKSHNLPWDIFSEEIGWVKYHPKPEYVVAFDPLDGSANYKFGRELLPHGSLIAVYKGLEPKLGEVVASGAMEFTRGKGWIYDGKETCSFKGEKIKIRNNWEINQSTPVNLDLYYEESQKIFLSLAQKVHVRWIGSTIGALMYLLENCSAMTVAPRSKPEEVGAVLSLIKGAGGEIAGLRDKEILESKFDSKKLYSFAAGSRNVVGFAEREIEMGLNIAADKISMKADMGLFGIWKGKKNSNIVKGIKKGGAAGSKF